MSHKLTIVKDPTTGKHYYGNEASDRDKKDLEKFIRHTRAKPETIVADPITTYNPEK